MEREEARRFPVRSKLYMTLGAVCAYTRNVLPGAEHSTGAVHTTWLQFFPRRASRVLSSPVTHP